MNKLFVSCAIVLLCVVSAIAGPAETACQRRRRLALDGQGRVNASAIAQNALIPECDANGNYAPLQCYGKAVGGGRFCQCWDKETQVVKGPSKSIKACDCIVQKHEAKSGEFSPKCQSDGFYEKAQCHKGQYWCVDPATGSIKGAKKSGDCNDAKC